MPADSPIDLRLGRWQDALTDVTCDALIVDAPYSERTHAGHNDGADTADGARQADYRARTGKSAGQTHVKRSRVEYGCWSADDVRDFVEHWSPRTAGWFVSITDHTLAHDWMRAMDDAGRYTFAPLPFITPGAGCRFLGDGPSNWTCWIVVGRPRTREAQAWRTLPGAYITPPGCNDRAGGAAHGGTLIAGGKPLWLMRALVRDYTRPGDVVCDPCSGGATTLLAAAFEGRRAVGAEMDADTFAKAQARIARTAIPVRPLLADVPRGVQGGMFDVEVR